MICFFPFCGVVWFHLKSTHTSCLLLDIMMIFSNNAANLTFQTHVWRKMWTMCWWKSKIVFHSNGSRVHVQQKKQSCAFAHHTVDGRNPAPVDMVNIKLFTRYYTSPGGAGFFSISSIVILFSQDLSWDEWWNAMFWASKRACCSANCCIIEPLCYSWQHDDSRRLVLAIWVMWFLGSEKFKAAWHDAYVLLLKVGPVFI